MAEALENLQGFVDSNEIREEIRRELELEGNILASTKFKEFRDWTKKNEDSPVIITKSSRGCSIKKRVDASSYEEYCRIVYADYLEDVPERFEKILIELTDDGKSPSTAAAAIRYITEEEVKRKDLAEEYNVCGFSITSNAEEVKQRINS